MKMQKKKMIRRKHSKLACMIIVDGDDECNSYKHARHHEEWIIMFVNKHIQYEH